jgi:hypothetical protein
VIPQPDVLDGGPVPLDVRLIELGLAGQRPLLDVVEPEREPGRPDVTTAPIPTSEPRPIATNARNAQIAVPTASAVSSGSVVCRSA